MKLTFDETNTNTFNFPLKLNYFIDNMYLGLYKNHFSVRKDFPYLLVLGIVLASSCRETRLIDKAPEIQVFIVS